MFLCRVHINLRCKSMLAIEKMRESNHMQFWPPLSISSELAPVATSANRVYCWASVVDGGSTVSQRCANVSCLLGQCCMCQIWKYKLPTRSHFFGFLVQPPKVFYVKQPEMRQRTRPVYWCFNVENIDVATCHFRPGCHIGPSFTRIMFTNVCVIHVPMVCRSRLLPWSPQITT